MVLILMFIRYILSVVLSLVYDCEEKVNDEHIVQAVTSYAVLLEDSLAPTPMMLMETFPFRMFAHTVIAWHVIRSTFLLVLQLPSWFPSATFKRASIKCTQAGQYVKEMLFQHVKEKMVKHFIHRGTPN
jgi:hypothetical protein